ncbi:uncharacterized protein LOC135938455 [Cloeon dipterum]|uniref:uncharacterized protein LOC135938455 n=1 Tax=Cloeon dipterum TaxID=197152 RepID=UPI00321FA714
MLSNIVLINIFLCCPFFLTVEQGEAVAVTDTSPSEYPYVVRISVFLPGAPIDVTIPGLVVSSKFVLLFQRTTDLSAFKSSNTDQFGVIRSPAKIESILDDQFIHFKFCNKFREAKYPLRESDFPNLTDAISDAHLLFFNITSTVLRKVTVPVMSKTDCAIATNSDVA